MRKWIDYVIFALCTLLQIFLLGCGSSQQAPTKSQTASPSKTSLTSVDWANFTYFSSCYQNTQPFHTKNGQAVNGYIHFYVYPPTYGDLTRDEQPEAVVPYQCTAADAAGRRVFVYTGDAAHVRLIGDLPSPDARGAIDNVTQIAISDEMLHLEGDGYSPGTPRCCPDLWIKTSYQWNGHTFVVTQHVVSKRVPG